MCFPAQSCHSRWAVIRLMAFVEHSLSQCHGSNDWFAGKNPRQEGARKLSPTELRGSLIEENGLELSLRSQEI